jgi:hypothetical protein
VIVALAGRRIDPPDAETRRFSQEQAPLVSDRIRELLQRWGATTLVASAACGADLLGQQAAGELGLRRIVVLPFEPARFRETSVTDRPGDWGPIFDRVIASVRRDDGSLIVLDHSVGDGSSHAGYAAVNDVVLDTARALAQRAGSADEVRAIAVWDGASRGRGDLTEHFIEAARARGIRVEEVATLPTVPADRGNAAE